MNIALIDVDGHNNFPNLALMKISKYHKQNGDHVEWFNPLWSKPQKIYMSKVFTFTPDYYYLPENVEIIKGGSGYNYETVLDKDIENICPDYELYNYPYAMGFLTRGCIRNCYFCIVPKKEGTIRPGNDIETFLDNKKIAILLDNNVLSSDYGLSQIEKIIKLKIKVDFNQGLDAMIICENQKYAKLLGKIKWLNQIRLACDNSKELKTVIEAIKILRQNNVKPQRYFIYMLVKDINDAIKREQELKKYNVNLFAQPYIDFSGERKITQEQRDFCRWINHRAIYNKCSYTEYIGRKKW